MLEKYDIEVDMAESAEQAIEYLKSNRPDAIFMDHLMPGMDGLQAVQAIKGNPQTAMIPIMMYTSQEGELYVGQARALGAMGVLPKQVRPVDVSKVLYELHLLPDRRDMTEAVLAPVELEGGAPVERTPAGPGAGATVDWGRRVETAVKNQAADVRRFIVASLDSFASRIVSDVRNSMPAPAPEPPPPPAPSRNTVWPWAAGLAATGLTARTARGCQVGQRWAGWAALLIGAASAPQAAASGFRSPYTIPDIATTALGMLLAITILATAGRMGRRDTTPQIPVCWTDFGTYLRQRPGRRRPGARHRE